MLILLTLLIISLAVIGAGLWLSPRTQPPTSQRISYAGRVGTRRTHRVGENRRAYVRRSSIEVERRAWANIVASLNIGRLFNRHKGQERPWLSLALILLTLFVLGIFALNTALPHSGLTFTLMGNGNTSAATTGGASSNSSKTVLSGPSKALIRINQLDPNQYSNLDEYNTWAYSTCSAASMTEVINSYGHNYRLTDVLRVESGIGEITAASGLLDPQGIDRTVAHFNFTTHWLNHPSVDDLVNATNNSTPVIVDFPPSKWSGGHILVVLGGNKDYVYLADSSRLNMQAMARKTFLKYWEGFGVVVTPVQQS